MRTGTPGHGPLGLSLCSSTWDMYCFILVKEGKEGLSVAWTTLTAAEGKAELMAENSLQPNPAQQHRLENME